MLVMLWACDGISPVPRVVLPTLPLTLPLTDVETEPPAVVFWLVAVVATLVAVVAWLVAVVAVLVAVVFWLVAVVAWLVAVVLLIVPLTA